MRIAHRNPLGTQVHDVAAAREAAPVLGCMRAEDLKEAVDLIIAHEYSNEVSLFTGDGNTAREFSRRAQGAWWASTCSFPCPWPGALGGWKKSMFGDMHAYGKEGVLFYTKQK